MGRWYVGKSNYSQQCVGMQQNIMAITDCQIRGQKLYGKPEDSRSHFAMQPAQPFVLASDPL